MDTDWALVVGIADYPGLPEKLNGPENDARDFFAWVTSPTGGDVPFDPASAKLVPGQNQAKCIVTTDVKRRLLAAAGRTEEEIAPLLAEPFASIDVAGPTRQAVEDALQEFDDISKAKAAQRKGSRVGRRLYLYFAGHGIAPTKTDAALLMADAIEGRFVKHVAGGAWADWLFETNKFAEVVLVMDCCRNVYSGSGLNPAFDQASVAGRDERTRYYVYGARWGKQSFERKMDDGKVHGILSRALLDGLKGFACDPATGQVTGATLRTFLAKYMVEYMAPEDRANPDLSKTPDIPIPDEPERPLVLAEIPVDSVPRLQVNLTLPPATVGAQLKVLQIRDVEIDVVETVPVASTTLTLSLKIGKYVARVDGPAPIKKLFEVRGPKAIDVTL